MVPIAVVGLWPLRGLGYRYLAGMLGLAAIGTGSALFHGTLLRVAQAADELPMVGLGLACVWAVTHRGSHRGEGGALVAWLAAFALCFVLAYATVAWAFALFVAVYGLMIAWVAWRTVRLTWWAPSSPAMRRTALGMLLGFGSAFCVFWLAEHVFLPCEHPLQALQLHSWWHVLGGVGTVSWWRWVAHDRAHQREMGADIRL
jgi:dihydroceramidase